jgi:preprotein translocase subunit SecG
LTKTGPAGCFDRFMSILIVVLTVLLVFVSVFLMLVVLVQKPRADSGLGTAMGGGMAEAAFGAETGNVLTRSTIYSAVAFFVLAFVLYLAQIHVSKSASKHEDRLPAAPVSAAPALPPVENPPAAQPVPATPAPEAPAPAAPKP